MVFSAVIKRQDCRERLRGEKRGRGTRATLLREKHRTQRSKFRENRKIEGRVLYLSIMLRMLQPRKIRDSQSARRVAGRGGGGGRGGITGKLVRYGHLLGVPVSPARLLAPRLLCTINGRRNL